LERAVPAGTPVFVASGKAPELLGLDGEVELGVPAGLDGDDGVDGVEFGVEGDDGDGVGASAGAGAETFTQFLSQFTLDELRFVVPASSRA
jgi:hypothetical protein